jgi:hypothetical protein
VRFVKWDESQRSREELETLQSLKLDTGSVVRQEGTSRVIIKWDSGSLDLGLREGAFEFLGMGFLGQHYMSEILEVQEDEGTKLPEPEIKVTREAPEAVAEVPRGVPITDVVGDDERREFMTVAKLRYDKDSKLFINPLAQKSTADEVKNLFKHWLVKKILFERLEALIKVDEDHASETNNQGFNQTDTGFCHSLYDAWFRYNHNWTAGQVAALAKCLYKYRGQLKSLMGEKYRPLYDSLGAFSNEYTDQYENKEESEQ